MLERISQRNRCQLARGAGKHANQCVEFFPGAFDPANPRKGGSFKVIQEKKWDNTPAEELAAYKLAQLPFPGAFCQNDRPTENGLEKMWADQTREKLGEQNDLQLLQKTFDRMK